MTEITDKISGLNYILYSKNKIVLMTLFSGFLVSDILFLISLKFVKGFMLNQNIVLLI